MQETVLLIIDDNKDDRRLYKRTLSGNPEFNFSFLEAESGESGLESINKQQPDCVLLDYSLPGRDGLEVLKKIRGKHLHLPVIILTGQGSESIAVKVMKEGAQDYIIKSEINENSLYRVLRIAIERCQMQKRVEEQRDALTVFTRALAHDLQEPIRTIKTFLTLIMQENDSSEKTKNYLHYIEKSSVGMERLVNTVYTYTSLDQQDMTMQICDTGTIIDNTLTLLASVIKENNVKVTYDQLPQVYGNEAHLGQLFQNLVNNAIKYGDKEQIAIHINAVSRGNYVEFSVKDNGPGIEEENLERIFEPFTRFIKHKEKGSGIGLATCKKIVNHHNGAIWCESKLGNGTTFFFTVPDKKEDKINYAG